MSTTFREFRSSWEHVILNFIFRLFNIRFRRIDEHRASFIRFKRGYFNNYNSDKNFSFELIIENVWFKREASIGIEFDYNDDYLIKYSYSIPFVLKQYYCIDKKPGRFLNRDTRFGKFINSGDGGREWRLSINSECLSIYWGQDTNSWDSKVNHEWYFCWDKLYRGKVTHTTLDIEESHEHVFIQPTFGNYPPTEHVLKTTKKQRTAKSARFWYPTKIYTYWDLDIVGKPPVFGSDGIWSMSANGSLTREQAVQVYIAEVIKNRKRRG